MDKPMARVIHEDLDNEWPSLGEHAIRQWRLEQREEDFFTERAPTFAPEGAGKDRPHANRPTPDTGILYAGAIMGAAILAVSIFNLLPISAFYKESNSFTWFVAALGGICGAIATFVNARARKSVE